MKTLLNIKIIIFMFSVICLVWSCDDFKDESPDIPEESIKDLSGSWKIVKATRNGTDITSAFDFSKFKLNINKDNSYTIEEYLPFIVRDNGTWETDDSQYPFKVMFKEDDAPEPTISTLNYPISGNSRQIKLTFSPGCYSNSYTYEFAKISN